MSDSAACEQSNVDGWRLNPRVQLHWRYLGEEWLVFEVLSGQTHHLDDLAAAVLTCFEPGDLLTRQALVERLDADYGAVLSPAQKDAALVARDQWAALGILVPVTTEFKLHAAV